ncbi:MULTISPECIES: oligosaccharide flippase family protein [Pseudomonadati]|uniref:Oligosaccharide flippase family protein n=1 Tax=Shewanella aestuarii TaxID=1028752 RepID=A0ABT0L212_9GAMM|nr:oligosaccharide flippase family protein [Shewanella aestuarii]MCL1117649.1 oligosaccharide flippase family protein [Shewanella aestuarii]GGN76270.1 polyhydroxyalkanoate synthase [Shewanella aestuarii]
MFKSKYVRNILTLVSSAFFAQILALLLTPILTRLYSPEEFGVFTAFIGYSGTLAAFIFLSLELAIVKSKSARELSSVLGLMLVISIFLLSILSITIYLESSFYTLIGFDKLFDIKTIVLLGVLCSATNLVLNQFISRKEQFSVYATSQISFVALRFVFSYLFFYFGYTQYGLVFGFILATILIIIYLYQRAEIYKERITLKKVYFFAALRKHKQLVIFNTPSNIINILIINFPIFFILKNFGLEAAGLFGLAYRMVMLPVTLVNKAIGQVIYKRFSVMSITDKTMLAFIIKNMLFLTLSFPGFVLLYLFGEEMFSFVFGMEWRIAGEFAALMSPFIFLSFLISPLSYYFVAYDKSDILMMISILFLGGLIVASLLFEFNDTNDFIKSYTLINVAYYITVLFAVLIGIKRAQ